MSFIFCTSGAIVQKAGVNTNANLSASAAILQQLSDDAEALICMATRYDWVTNYNSASSYAKLILAKIASSEAAKHLIADDMSGYTGRGEAEDMINVLHDDVITGIQLLKNYKRPVDEV